MVHGDQHPSRSNSDQHHISLCNINALSVRGHENIGYDLSVDRLRNSRRLCYKLCVTTRKDNLQGDVGN